MDHTVNAEIPLARHIEVSTALHYLGQELGCDNWYVACHHAHVFVFRLSHGSADRFAVRVECTEPVEKAVYHGSKAWSLSITSLHQEPALRNEQLKQLELGLAKLQA